MPYITQGARRRLTIAEGEEPIPESSGELNYVITKLVDGYLKRVGMNYASLNSVIGVLECAKLELYRRIVIPYENKKKLENGDVYEVDK